MKDELAIPKNWKPSIADLHGEYARPLSEIEQAEIARPPFDWVSVRQYMFNAATHDQNKVAFTQWTLDRAEKYYARRIGTIDPKAEAGEIDDRRPIVPMPEGIRTAIRKRAELMWRRENLASHRVVPAKDRPVPPADEEYCPQWRGGWIMSTTPDGVTTYYPSGCGKNYCPVCGPKKWAKRIAEFREGALNHPDFEGRETPMGTLTFRARRTLSWEGLRYPEKWSTYINREMSKGRLKKAELKKVWVPSKWHEMTEKEFCDWPIKQGYTTQMTVMWRGLLSPAQWRRYITGCMIHLRYCWEQVWKEKFTAVVGMEFHQSGIPHSHYAYRRPLSMTRLDVAEAWLKRVWAKIVNDSEPHEVQVDLGYEREMREKAKDRNFRFTVQGSLEYALKYMCQDVNVNINQIKKHAGDLRRILKNAGNPYIDDQDDDDPEAVQNWDWNRKIRRYNASNWPKATIAQLGTLRDADTNLPVDRRKRAAEVNTLTNIAQTDILDRALAAWQAEGEHAVVTYKPIMKPDHENISRFGQPEMRMVNKKPWRTVARIAEQAMIGRAHADDTFKLNSKFFSADPGQLEPDERIRWTPREEVKSILREPWIQLVINGELIEKPLHQPKQQKMPAL